MTNFGTIAGTGTAGIGVYLAGSDTLTNAGTIIGNSGTAVYFGGTANRLVVDPGAVFSGVVAGGRLSSNTLELAAGDGAGTLNGLGTSFTNLGTVTVDSGASWVLAGTNKLSTDSTLTNSGTMTLAATRLGGRSGTVDNSGTLQGAGGSITVAPTIASTGEVLENTGPLRFVGGGSFSGTIVGSGEVDLLAGKAYTFGPSLAVSVAQLNVRGAGTSLTLEGSVSDTGSFRLGPGAVLQTQGTLAFLGGVSNGGSIVTTADSLFLDGGISSGGTTGIDAGALVRVTGTAAAAHTVDFAGSNAMLDLATLGNFASTVAGFTNTDTIDLLATPVTGLVY